ncbi:unnamed protein product [Cochlearia groenlandica]
MMGEDIERVVASLPVILKTMEEQSKTIAALAFRQEEYAAQQAEYLAAMKTSNQQLEALTLQVRRMANVFTWYQKSLKKLDHRKDYQLEDEDIYRDDYPEYVEREERPRKMEFPKFDGTTDPTEWIQNCDDHFLDQRVAEVAKIWASGDSKSTRRVSQSTTNRNSG